MEQTTCIVLTKDNGKILRKKAVTTFAEVEALHKQFPTHDIAIFEDPEGHGGEMWAYYPEHFVSAKWWRR